LREISTPESDVDQKSGKDHTLPLLALPETARA
jgi:hypothetical protein